MGVLSKACEPCKKKKVKCDEIRPICTRCRRASIECIASIKRLRFVNENPRMERSMAISKAQSHEFATVTKGPDIAFHSSRIWSSARLSHPPFWENAMPLTAFKDSMFMSYLLDKLFEGGYRGPYTDEHPCGGLPFDWVHELVETPQKARDKSWDALGAIVFGQAHKSYDVIKKALALYGVALSELRQKLSDQGDRHSDSTLACMTALYMYEVSSSFAVRH
jgi:hypothetical protein